MAAIVVHADVEVFDLAAGQHSAVFPIPAGVFTAGQWDETTTMTGPGSSPDVEISTRPAGAQVQTATYADLTPAPASAGQLADINAASGGYLTAVVTFGCSGSLVKHFSLLTLTLTGTLCSWSIAPVSASYPYGGGGGTVAVTAGSCPWTSAPNTAWLHVTGGGSGTASGTLSYACDPNPFPAPRTGTITIAGLTFSVSQAAYVDPLAGTGATVAQAPAEFSPITNQVYESLTRRFRTATRRGWISR